MSHYEERLERDLQKIRKRVRKIGELVEQAVADASRAALSLDRDLANETILGDHRVNRETRDLDRLCHGFVARHLPSAGHLRFVSSVLRLNIATERIGDYAETISRTAVQLSEQPPEAVATDIQMMADQARRLLHRAMRAFDQGDAEAARQTITAAKQLPPAFDKVFADLVVEGDKGSRPMRDLFAFLATQNRLERVIHQAKNICEETIFAVTGETKPKDIFDILFVDAHNDGPSQLAEHIVRKGYPESGRYQSAGWDPASSVDSAYVQFAESRGLDLSDAWPRSLQSIPEQMSEFEVVVALDGAGREQLGKMPFHTVLLSWDIAHSTSPEEVYKELAPRISELMEKLTGEEA